MYIFFEVLINGVRNHTCKLSRAGTQPKPSYNSGWCWSCFRSLQADRQSKGKVNFLISGS